MDKNKWPGRIILIAIFLFFYFPILYMIVFSFNDSRSLTSFGSFSLQWYEHMLNNHTMIESIWYTVLIAIVATYGSSTITCVQMFATFAVFAQTNPVHKNLVLGRNVLDMMLH